MPIQIQCIMSHMIEHGTVIMASESWYEEHISYWISARIWVETTDVSTILVTV